MPSKSKRTHNDNCLLVCAICYNESGKKCERKVSAVEELAIKQHICSGYSREDPSFPWGICRNCHFILSDWIAGKENPRSLPVSEDYDSRIPRNTRSLTSCTCRICHLARLNGSEWKAFVKKCKKKDRRESNFNKESGIRLCSNCFSRIFRGSNHSEINCKSKRAKIENLENAVDDDDLEKLARNTIENVTVTNESGDKTCHLRSVRGGRYPASFNIGKATVATEENAFSFDDVLALQSEANLSDRYSVMF